MVKALVIYVTGILALWRVVDSLSAWECLCGHDVCEWCSWPYEPLALPTPGLSLYWHTDGTAVVMGRYDHDLV